MSTAVFFAVLGSSFMQASWNFLAKKSTANKTVLLLIGWLLFGLVSVPIASLYTDFSLMTATSWKFVLFSGIIHFVYVMVLGWAYTVGEISVVYPVARGVGVALTCLTAYMLGWDELSFQGCLGVGAIIIGTLFIAGREVKKLETLKGLSVALLLGSVISTYSLVDSRGALHVPIFFFIGMMNLLTALIAAPLLFTRYKKEALSVLKERKLEAFFIAFAGSAAYLIILWAYTQTSTSYVVALREFSIVIASGLGVTFLKERLYSNKVVGVMTILLGVVLVRVS
ncbi:MAG: EamA family transporter [Bdellovibrionales bacterium]